MTEEFKIFLEYYKRVFKVDVDILNESPVERFEYGTKFLDDNTYNVNYADEVVKTYEKLDTIQIVNVSTTLFRKEEKDVFYDNWLLSPPRIIAEFMFRKVDNGVKFGGVWNSMHYKGAARMLIFNYYLKQFSFIQSDSTQSQYGKKYWLKLIEQALADNYNVTILDIETNKEINYSTDIQAYNHSNLVFKIYSKEKN